jgi:hypothetical protein
MLTLAKMATNAINGLFILQDRDYAIATLEIHHSQHCALISLSHLAVCILFLLILARSREGSAKQCLRATCLTFLTTEFFN